jgi:hypothetical protein
MAINYVTIKGYVRGGKLEVELPDNVTEGEAEIIVPIATEDDDLTPQELQEYLNFKGLPLGEIHVGGWEEMEIEDSVEFIQSLRRKSWRKYDLE